MPTKVGIGQGQGNLAPQFDCDAGDQGHLAAELKSIQRVHDVGFFLGGG